MTKPIKFIPKSINPYEVWVPVRGLEEDYQISNMGRIFDCNNGYICVTIRKPNERYLFSVHINEYVHIAMMRSFMYFDGCENYYVRHKDGLTLLNYLPNLEWVNYYIPIEYGNNNGSAHYRSTITENQVYKVCQMLQDNADLNEIEKITGVSKHNIYRIKYRHSWKHISKDYNWIVDAKLNKKITYSNDQVKDICQTLQDYPEMPCAEIARKFNVPDYFVVSINRKRIRTDISKNYTWNQNRDPYKKNIDKYVPIANELRNNISVSEIAKNIMLQSI